MKLYKNKDGKTIVISDDNLVNLMERNGFEFVAEGELDAKGKFIAKEPELVE